MPQDWSDLKLSSPLTGLLESTGFVETEPLRTIRQAAQRALARGDHATAWQYFYSDDHLLVPVSHRFRGSYRKLGRKLVAAAGGKDTFMELGVMLAVAGAWRAAEQLANYIGELQDALEFALGSNLSTHGGRLDEPMRQRIESEARFPRQAQILFEAWENAQHESMRRWREQHS